MTGVVSDIRAIAEAVHEFGIPLIVDEAHGAHFGFHPYFPENANQQGADVVIHSVHKTLPCSDPDGLTSYEWESGRSGGCAEISAYVSIQQSFVYLDGRYRCMYGTS